MYYFFFFCFLSYDLVNKCYLVEQVVMVYVSFSLSLRGEYYLIKINQVLNNVEKR